MSANDWLWLPAPAKLNLFLRIVGQRSDGYHLLQTIFQLIDLCDHVGLRLRSDGEIILRTPIVGLDDAQELTVRAARSLGARMDRCPGVEIRHEKRIPMGGGLGGGSSDAATVLLALNWLWDARLGVDELAGIGLELGADVPVFVRGSSAWAENLGEDLVALELPPSWYVVVHPGIHVETKAVFTHPGLTRNSEPIKIPRFLSGEETDVEQIDVGRILDLAANDCEILVRELHTEVDRALDWISSRATSARLTGTGAAVFGAFRDRASALEAKADAPRGWTVCVAEGMQLSPTLSALRKLGCGLY